ncbi:MAG: hypothetical protein ABI348_08350 [Nitrososphaera sp.]
MRYSSSLDSGIIEIFSFMHDGHTVMLLSKTLALQKHDSHSAKCLSDPIVCCPLEVKDPPPPASISS